MIDKKTNNILSNINLKIEKRTLRTNKLFGLWIYLMSDCIIFAVLFSVYSIISSNVSVDIFHKQFFHLSDILLETFFLLLSSLSCGLSIIGINKKNINITCSSLIVTFFLGASFLFMEINEFYNLIEKKFSPDQDAFFSIFFTLIGTHGIHVFFGLIIILSILYQIKILGLTHSICTRILCLSIFWHFLDIIWICVFTIVYLNGVL